MMLLDGRAHLCLIAVVCIGTLSIAFADTECNGRGHKSDGKCVCDTPRPGFAELGYVGADCELRVFGAHLDGSDMASSCGSNTCNKLQVNEWLCFYAPVDWSSSSDPWNYMAIQLNRTSQDENGDPDLYGMFYSSDEGTTPEESTYEYQFRETSSGSRRSVVKKIKKADFTGHAYEGVYMCVKAYGEEELTFSLKAVLSKCPADFSPDTGERMECSSPLSSSEKRHTGCNDDGTCICKPPYVKPLAQTYDNLGFEDCSAKVTDVPDSAFEGAHTYVVQHQEIAAKAWNFYSFNVMEADYQTIVNVAGESDNDGECSKYGYFGAYLKYGQPPGWRYGEYDLRPKWDYVSEDDSDLEIQFDRNTDGYQTGQWYLGINGEDTRTCKYTLTISKFDCPNNCTGRGQCQHQANGTHTCSCDQGYFGGDCSQHAEALAYDKPLNVEEAAFEYQYYELPEVSPAMLTHPVEVSFSVSFFSSNYGYWTTAKPELLLLKGDKTTHPTAGNYTFKVALEEANKTYSLDLCPSQLKQGVWRAAIYNPMRIYQIGYNFNVTKKGACLNGCTGHGTCTPEGVCECTGNWAGGDCSVDTSAGTCRQGSRLPSKRPEQKGTCWQECHCDDSGSCSFQSSCVDFTCDSPKLRRKGEAAECVEDECTQDAWEETEVHSCLRPCNCPSDGSKCTQGAECKEGSFACKMPYKRFSSGAAKCYPVGCLEGSLTEAMVGSVDNGKAYGVCRCGGESDEREDEPLCKVAEADPQAMSITCQDGYSLKGAMKQSSSGPWLGGECVRSKRGTAAWAVVLWVFLSLLVGAGGTMAGLWVYEHKLRAPVGGHGSNYHELSFDTGF